MVTIKKVVDVVAEKVTDILGVTRPQPTQVGGADKGAGAETKTAAVPADSYAGLVDGKRLATTRAGVRGALALLNLPASPAMAAAYFVAHYAGSPQSPEAGVAMKEIFDRVKIA